MSVHGGDSQPCLSALNRLVLRAQRRPFGATYARERERRDCITAARKALRHIAVTDKRNVPPTPPAEPNAQAECAHMTLAHSQFRLIQSKLVSPCTREAYIGRGGPLLTSATQQGTTFVGSDCTGQQIWLQPPVDQIPQAIAWYKQQKQLSPYNTSACIAVPAWRKATWKKQLSSMQLIHQIPKGTALLTTQSNDGAPVNVPSPYGIRIYYDSPTVISTAAVTAPEDQGLLMRFDGAAAATYATIALDSMASHCFISSTWAEKAGIAVQPCNEQVTLASGKQTSIQGTSSVLMTLGSYSGRVQGYVMPLAECHEIILGNNWLKQNKATLSWETNTVRLKKGKRTITIKCRNPSLAQGERAPPPGRRKPTNNKKTKDQPSQLPDITIPQLSAVQFHRTVRKGAEAFILRIKPVLGATAVQAEAHTAGSAGAQERHAAPAVLAELEALIHEYSDVFPSELPAGLPPDRGLEPCIPLAPGAQPPHGYMFRLSAPEKAEVEKQVKMLLSKGLIEPSTSPFGAPVLFARKKDGGLRMVLDYRALNKITIKNRYPIPRIDDLLDQLQGSKCWSSADLMSGYWQLRIDESDVPKTAFKTHIGLYQWKVLPMGISNGPSAFVTAMSKAMRKHINVRLIVYMDDLLIYSKNEQEHLRDLRAVLQTLREEKLYLKKEKCHFLKEEVEFLGHIVSKDGIKVDPTKVAAVKDWPTPKDVSEVRSFLGLTNYFRKFIVGYASVVRPMTALLAKDAPYTWSPQCSAAFEAVKHALTSAPVLKLPDLNKPFVVVTDASDFCLGACLMQDGHPVAFESRKLIPAERNYHTGEKELLALVHALKIWRCYLEGVPFTAVTDHNPNVTFATKTTLSPRQARWTEFLARFKFEWKYEPGRTNVADPLSRRPDMHKIVLAAITRSGLGGRPPPDATVPDAHPQSHARTDHPARKHRSKNKKRRATDPLEVDKPAANEPPAQRTRRANAGVNRSREVQPGEEQYMRQALGMEPTEAPPKQRAPRKQAAAAPAETQKKQTASTAEELTLRERIRAAYQHDASYADAEYTAQFRYDEELEVWMYGDAVAVPSDSAVRQAILHEIHCGNMSGHVGTRKSLEALSRAFYWPGMHAQMREYVRTCDQCLRNKSMQSMPAGKLQPLPIPKGPWSSITTDLIVKLPATKRGYDSIIVIVDRLTKMVHFAPCKSDINSVGYAHVLLNEVVRHHGQPREIISDRGPQFTSALWRDLCNLTGCKAKLSSAYHPQTDGQSERVNRFLEEMLRAYVSPQQDDWDIYLPLAEFAVNDAWHESIQTTPFYMNYGRHPIKPATIGLESAKVPKAQDLARKIKQTIERAKVLLNAARQRQKAYADARRSERSFAVGDEVLLSTKNIRLKTPGTQKLMPRYVGPFKIKKRISEVAYELELPAAVRRVHPIFHVSLLRPYPVNAAGRRPDQPMPLLLDEEGDWYEVEAVIADRMSRGKRQYLIKWTNFDEIHNEWRNEHDVTDTAVAEYWANKA